MKTINVSWPYIDNSDIKYVSKGLRNGFLGVGDKVKEFEHQLKKVLKVDKQYICSVSTGTDAIKISLLLSNINKGDEVILSSFNFIAAGQAVLMLGAIPVFCDINSNDYSICKKSFKKKLSKKTKAVILLDYASQIFNYDEIIKICKKKSIKIIRDCAHIFGSKINNKFICKKSDFVIFSFDPIKTITTIDGGAIVIKNKKDYLRCINIRQLGYGISPNLKFMQNNKINYDVREIGTRDHLSNIHACIGLSQLKKFKKISLKRIKLYNIYRNKLNKNKYYKTLSLKNDAVPFIFVLEVHSKSSNKLRQFLKKNKIMTGLHWYPMHKMSIFKKYNKNNNNLDNTEKIYKKMLTLPLHNRLNSNDVKLICDKINSFYK